VLASPRPDGARRRVELVQLPTPVIDALGAGDLATANRLLVELGTPRVPAYTLTPYLVASECRGTWRRRSRQIAADPASASWVTRVIVDADRDVVVGRAGFHGPPDADGRVEIGYAVDPRYRRRGYARAALEALLAHATGDPGVRTVRATIGPANRASSELVTQYGFAEVGEQDDDEDGLETIYEVGVAD
jgi:RimJ/RimL family protein N-acetyltransferase